MPPMEIVFTTKGIGKLNATMIAIGKKFDALDAKFGAGSKLTQGAKDVVIAAVYLERAADKVKKAAVMLKSATGGSSLSNALTPKNPPAPRTPKAPPSFGKKLMQLIGTSRVSFGKGGSPQIMPLVNKMTNLLPPEVQPFVMAAVAAGTALYQVAHQAEEAATKFAALQAQFGSDAKMTGFLKGIGAAAGLDGQGVASAAAALNSRIVNDPMAKALGVGLGVQNAGGFYGNQDYGAQLKQVIDGLRKVKDTEQRLAIMRELGIENMYNATTTSDRQYNRHNGDGAVKSQIFSPEFAQQAADMADSFGRVMDAGENFLAALGKPLMKDLTDWFNETADELNKMALWMNNHQGVIKAIENFFKGIMNAVGGNWQEAFKDFGKMKDDWNSPHQQVNDALNDHADAIRELNETMRRTNQLLPGTYGRSARLGDANMSPMQREYLGHALQAGGIQLNPF